jgi:predicted nucleotidyltransferase
MRREEVLNALQLYRDELRGQYDVASLLLFGSVARGESIEGSDVDLLVEFGQPPGFDGYMSLKFRLESEKLPRGSRTTYAREQPQSTGGVLQASGTSSRTLTSRSMTRRSGTSSRTRFRSSSQKYGAC